MSAGLQSQATKQNTQNKAKQKAGRRTDRGRGGRERRAGRSTSCPSVVFLAWDRVNLVHRICNEPLLFVTDIATDIAPLPPRCLHLFGRNECRSNGENSGGGGVAGGLSCTVGRDEKKEFWEFSETKSIRFKSAKVEQIRNPFFLWHWTVSCV